MATSKQVFRSTVIARALVVAFGAGTMAIGVHTSTFAQTNATGTIYGQVDAASGATLSILNKDTGTRRSIKPDATGHYAASALPVGNYKVELLLNGAVTKSSDDVQVRIGQGSEVSFVAALQAVQITGALQKIDVSSMGSTTIFTASDLAKIPVANNVGAVIQLAPNTTRGDSRYGGGNAPSFGGSSASENAYYINGFPVTTLLTQVGFSQLPFNAIAQAQVLTGGYGAEFGRSTGGVVNIVTKSGTNEWVAGGAVSVEPNGLRAKSRDQYYENNGTVLDGKLYVYNGLNKSSTTSTSAYLGGPLIKDKLFMFAALENTSREVAGTRTVNTSASYTASATAQSTAFNEIKTETPRYLLKLDWNLTDANKLDYTHISDTVNDRRTYFGFDYKTLQRTFVSNGGQSYVNWGPTPVAAQQGASVDILKYTSYLNDDLTLTALVGRTYTAHDQAPSGYNASIPQVIFDSSVQAPGLVYNKAQGISGSLVVPGAFDENIGGRADIEYKLNSKNTLRAGIDANTITSKAGSAYAGGSIWEFLKTDPTKTIDKYSVATNTVAGNAIAQQGYYVRQSIVSNSSTPTVEQSAWYLEDRFQATDRLLLSLGLRNEAFNNKNGDKLSYVKLPTQLAPRVGASWDVSGDSSLKVFSNLGRYHVPLPTNVAVRGAGSSLFTQQNFAYTGVDANGVPTGLTALSKAFSNNNEYGQAKNPLEVSAENMKGNFQDELAFGFEQAVSRNLNIGGKFTYRTLRTAIDDHCDDRPFIAWAARNKVDASNFGYNCALFNPGIGNTFNIDINGDGKLEHIVLSAADLGFPKVDRKYTAVDLFAERPFDGKWWGKVTYTWSRNKGNTEGQTLSDIGQADVSTSQAFDFPEFSINANGRLPNDRTHQMKAFGYFQATPEWGVGGNFLMATGRPKNCIGNAPTAALAYSGYGSAYFFCKGIATPRGTQGDLPADIRLDMNLSYKPEAAKGFGVKLDIFNLFNRQSAQTIEERYNNAGGATTVRSLYAGVLSYTSPRSAKLTATYDYKF